MDSNSRLNFSSQFSSCPNLISNRKAFQKIERKENWSFLPPIKSSKTSKIENKTYSSITAESWVVSDGNTGNLLFGKNPYQRKEIASLTKIMTCYTTLLLSKLYNIDLKVTFVTVSKNASLMKGTTANLEEGDRLLLWDLLYGLMLPSGNDAAITIAEYIGGFLFNKYCPHAVKKPRRIMKLFINEMNSNCRALGLTQTNFSNPNGLADPHNKSTAHDIALLSALSMKNSSFRQIVSCRYYKASGFNIGGKPKKFHWYNTNFLLENGFNGVKTGITPTAGPCLCTSIEKKNKHLIIVLLNSESTETRWNDTKKLVTIALNQIGINEYLF